MFLAIWLVTCLRETNGDTTGPRKLAFLKEFLPGKTNISPENQWLEDVSFVFGGVQLNLPRLVGGGVVRRKMAISIY